MTSKNKKWIKRLTVVILFFLALSVLSNIYIKSKINAAITKLPGHVQLNYKGISVNSIAGNVSIEEPIIKVFNAHSKQLEVEAKGLGLKVRGASIWNYLVHKEIIIDQIKFEDFKINHINNKDSIVSTKPDFDLSHLGHDLSVDKISFENTEIKSQASNEDAIFSLKNLNLDLLGFKLNQPSKDSIAPISVEGYDGYLNEFVFRSSPYEDMLIDTILIKGKQLIATKFQLKTRYSRRELSSLLKTERDHFDIVAESVVFDDLNMGMTASERFFFSSQHVSISNPRIDVFRDKLVNDSYKIKPLYGKMLRDLKMEMSIDTLNIVNGNLSYSEKVKTENKGGQLDFENLNSTVLNLGNTYGKDTTAIAISAEFMKHSPIDINWKFVVQNPSDDFSFSGELDYFKVDEISQFSRPNLNVEFRGDLKKTYFNINGNPYVSDIDLKSNFENFRVVILKKNGKEKNKFLSGLVNMFVSTNSDNDPKEFYYGNINNIERDRTKSIFNFVWKNIEAGLVSAMTGSGKKKN